MVIFVYFMQTIFDDLEYGKVKIMAESNCRTYNFFDPAKMVCAGTDQVNADIFTAGLIFLSKLKAYLHV